MAHNKARHLRKRRGSGSFSKKLINALMFEIEKVHFIIRAVKKAEISIMVRVSTINLGTRFYKGIPYISFHRNHFL